MLDSIEAPTEVNNPVQRMTLGLADPDTTIRGPRKMAPPKSSDISAEVIIGQPRSFDLQDLLRLKRLRVAPEIASTLPDYGYFLVELNYSFIPTEGHRIIKSRIRIEIISNQRNSGASLVYDLYPLEIGQQIPNPWRVLLGTDFRFYEPSALIHRDELIDIVFPKLSPQVFGSGRQTKAATWIFRQWNNSLLRGALVTYFVIQIPINCQSVDFRMDMSAQVSGPLVKGPFVSLVKVVREQSSEETHTLRLPVPATPKVHSVDGDTYDLRGEVPQGISPDIYNRLRDVLLDCGPFAGDRTLRAVFTDARISPWSNSLPEADNPANRVEVVINFLYNKYNDDQENALVLLLQVLIERLDPRDACSQYLTELANKLEHLVS